MHLYNDIFKQGQGKYISDIGTKSKVGNLLLAKTNYINYLNFKYL